MVTKVMTVIIVIMVINVIIVIREIIVTIFGIVIIEIIAIILIIVKIVVIVVIAILVLVIPVLVTLRSEFGQGSEWEILEWLLANPSEMDKIRTLDMEVPPDPRLQCWTHPKLIQLEVL